MQQLSDRKQALFSAIVEEYVATAKPVGSKSIVDNHKFGVSPATIRNEMKELEDMGFITHPHTSAGRIPTAAGYTYYVEHFVNPEANLKKPLAEELHTIASATDHAEPEILVKHIAKGIAELSCDAVLVSLSKYSYYYTGISNMFSKPEFATTEVIYSLTKLIDQFDEVMPTLSVKQDIDILIGNDNPISTLCSTVVTEYRVSDDTTGIIAILGPMRMEYQQNYSLLKYVRDLLAT